MAQRSLRQTVRRVIGPVAFLGALTLLGVRTCGTEIADVEFSFDFGRAAPQMRALKVDVYRGDDVAPVSYHSAEFGEGGAPEQTSWKLQLDPGEYVLKMRVTTSAGTQLIQRRAQVEDRARIRVSLEDELVEPR